MAACSVAVIVAFPIWAVYRTPLRYRFFVETLPAPLVVPPPPAPAPLLAHSDARSPKRLAPRHIKVDAPTTTLPQQSSVQPPVINMPPNQSPNPPGFGIYERVQRASQEISEWERNYTQQTQSAAMNATRSVSEIYRTGPPMREDDPNLKKLRDEAQKRADRTLKETYRRIDDTANTWIAQKQAELKSIHLDVVAHMRSAKPRVWTPNEVIKDQQAFR